jgi:hypothetical protein
VHPSCQTLGLMTNNPNDCEPKSVAPTEMLFRDAERSLDMAFRHAVPSLVQHGILWSDYSYRDHAFGSFSHSLMWRLLLTKPWVDNSGAACVTLNVFVLEPLESSWGIPMHWQMSTFSQPKLLSDATAHSTGSAKLAEVISGGFDQFLLECIEKEASRIGRKL